MTVRNVTDAPSTRANLNNAIAVAQPHVRPILEAVRDHRCGMLFVEQSADPFRIPRDPARTAIVMIGDDFDRAVGPSGFHLPSIRRAIRACSAFAVVSCEPLQHVYLAITFIAVGTRKNVMLVETRPEQEISWVQLIQKLAPGLPLLWATVEGARQ